MTCANPVRLSMGNFQWNWSHCHCYGGNNDLKKWPSHCIPIKFYIVSNSCAMKAKISAKKCTTHSEFQPFTFLFSHLSASSSLVAFCVQQFWMHDNFIKNWWYDGKCRTKKKMSTATHREAPFSWLKLFP